MGIYNLLISGTLIKYGLLRYNAYHDSLLKESGSRIDA
jgi:hypothetical protein